MCDSLTTTNGYWYYRYPLYCTAQPRKREKKLSKICLSNMPFSHAARVVDSARREQEIETP